MMNRWWMMLVLGMILVVVLASCGDDGESRDTTPTGVCTSYAERYCQADEKCSPSFQNFWNDRATCYEREKLGCISRLTASGVNDTPSRIAACADALASFSCDAYLDDDRWPETCTPLPGQLPDGAGCIAWGQCQGGMCWITSRQACGVCKTVSRIGGACTSENDCLNFMPCVNGVCAAHPRRGEACNDEARYCVEGSACRDIDASGVGTCQAPSRPAALAARATTTATPSMGTTAINSPKPASGTRQRRRSAKAAPPTSSAA